MATASYQHQVPALPNDIDPTRQHLSYGRQAIPKLIEELNQAKTQIRSLVSLCGLFHSADSVAQALQADVVVILTNLLSNEGLVVKQKATESVFVLSGKKLIVRNKFNLTKARCRQATPSVERR